MSGSRSSDLAVNKPLENARPPAPVASGRNAAARPLGLTVHALEVPDLQAVRRRTVSGRLKMTLVLLACAAPVLASYLAYYVIRPEGRTNYGALIQPTRSLPAALPLRTLQGEAVPAQGLRGQWLLVAAGDAACPQECEQRLYMQRQLREMLGRDKDRVDRVWLITDEAMPSANLRAALAQGEGAQLLHVPRAELERWLQPEPGQSLEAHLYLVDPMGEWMMRFPPSPEPSRVRRDLERLLRAAASWDRAGR